MRCTACSLHKTRHSIVRGEGSSPANVVLIGEAPGRSEDLLGRPFVGRSGDLLRKMLEEVWHGEVSYYLTNTIMCRPTDSMSGENREPTKEEICACREMVLCGIAGVSHDRTIVVFVGKVAERSFRKEVRHLRQFTLVHPAALLRGGGKASPYYIHNKRILENVNEHVNSDQ
jgi:uracil-DNA glycosylase family 4